jgi:hypothetical protein
MPHRLRFLLSLLALALVAAPWGTTPAQAQRPATPDSLKHNLSSFEELDFPTPTDFRAANGEPGEDYWQQRADYTIDVRLEPDANRITGTETITYTNNAPDALNALWLQLDQNLFDPESRGAAVVPPDARFSGFFDEGGYEISNLRLVRDGETVEPDYVIDDTRMRIALDEPMAPEGSQLQIKFDYSFIIPEYGADRMGRLPVEQGTIYQLAQWYPRMYVYDDVHGWNPLPYLGQGEYYLEFGTFNVNITVPRDFTVAATGQLQNPEEVLTATQRQRLDRARSSRETVMIIDSTEVGTAMARPSGSGPLTWRFQAEEVRDFAWAASQAFIWDAAQAETEAGDVLAQSYYPKESLGTAQNPGWEESTRYTQHSVEFYSEFTDEPYPYPVAINVAGRVLGMEYPQIVFCAHDFRGQRLFGVTDHEFGHAWFPMVVATDERRWVWMDEGINTFMNQYSTDAFYEQSNTQSLQQLSQLTTRFMQSPLGDQPSMTKADRMRSEALGFLAYRKPANGLMLLRDYVVGPELFDLALQTFVDRWKYKHPKPADFFRTIEDVTGENLDWFWRSWFYETDVLDQAVTRVAATDSTARVTVASHHELQLPVVTQVTFADGSTTERRLPVEAFYTRDTHTMVFETDRTVQKVVVDPQRLLPDIDRSNNTWTLEDRMQQQSGASSSSSR